MKNKKLLISISVLVFAAALILCASALFSLADITLISNGECKNIDEAKISEELDEYLGKSVLFLGKDKIEKNISHKFPYVKVESIIKDFPNRLEVSISERKELFCVKSGDNYYILDDEGYILALKQENVNNIDASVNTIIAAEIDGGAVGEKAVLKDCNLDAVLDCANLLKKLTYSNAEIRFLFKEIFFLEGTMRIKTGYGVTFVIDDYTEQTIQKFNVLLAAFNASADERKIAGELIVYINSSGQIEAAHSFKV